MHLLLWDADDVQDCILRAAARASLPLASLVKIISAANYNLEEPPAYTAPWVGEMLERATYMATALLATGLSQSSLIKARTNSLSPHNTR